MNIESKKQNKTLLMVMVDAFRHDYITEEDCPFLYKKAKEGCYGSLIPSFGFEPDGAYLAGLDPDECDGGAQYWRNPEEQAFYFTWLFSFLYILPIKKWRRFLRLGARFIAQKAANPNHTFTRNMSPTSDIPFNVLKNFSFSMKKLACEPELMSSKTFFDVMREKNLSYFFHGHPAYKVRIDSVVKRYLEDEKGGNAFAYLFIGDLDREGHAYGPDSNERRAMLRRIDDGLRKIYEHAQTNYKEVDLIVFGDHGMADVKGTIDFSNVISVMNLGEDDTYFLDSTFARFWAADKTKREQIIDILSSVEHGHVLSEREKKKYKIQFSHNYFGDIIFAIDDNYLIHPSFYGADKEYPLGMHGYLPGCRDNESAFLISSPSAEDCGDKGRVDMRRIFPTILKLLGIEKDVEIPHRLKDILE